MKASDLESKGFVKDASDGLFYTLDGGGAIVRFGKIVHSPDGEESGVEVSIDQGAQSAVAREWHTRIHPHPDGDPEYSLAQFLDAEKAAMLESPLKMRCAFCAKTDAEVARLIAGPQSMICNECVMLCHEILTG